MNRTDRLSRHTSPRRDPVLLAIQLACLFLAAVLAGLIVSACLRAHAQGALNCPPQDHAVWASSLHQWLCGDSLQVGVKSR